MIVTLHQLQDQFRLEDTLLQIENFIAELFFFSAQKSILDILIDQLS